MEPYLLQIRRMEVDLPNSNPNLDYTTALTYPPKCQLTISPPPANVGLPYTNDCPLLICGFSEKVQFTLQPRPRPYNYASCDGRLVQHILYLQFQTYLESILSICGEQFLSLPMECAWHNKLVDYIVGHR